MPARQVLTTFIVPPGFAIDEEVLAAFLEQELAKLFVGLVPEDHDFQTDVAIDDVDED